MAEKIEAAQETDDELVVSVVSGIGQIDAHSWDACANPPSAPLNPFVSHAFLKALEDSDCVGVETGWIPRHLVLRDGQGNVCGVMACYIKLHSRGEFVFDHAWAEGLERAGGDYYPKLQCAVPFTPVPGPRVMVHPGPLADRYERALAGAAVELSRQMELSSLHITFVSHEVSARLGEMGFLARTDQQYHWKNDGFASFEAFLDTLSSRKRKSVRRERLRALDSGVVIEQLRGDDILPEHWDAFYAFYLDTGSRKWGSPYLNRAFFKQLGETMGEQCLLVMAMRDGVPIAGALNLIGGDRLYGRYWGALEHVDCLHFEVCYYQAIDFAIAHGLACVEAGAQGEHKLARGYVPTTTYSAHWIFEPGLRDAVARYLETERKHIARRHEALLDFTPFKKDAGRK